jgi:hypothetical protein
LRQIVLARAEKRRKLSRDWQRLERQHPVGPDFQQPLLSGSTCQNEARHWAGYRRLFFALVAQNQIRSLLEMAKWVRKFKDRNNCNANNFRTIGENRPKTGTFWPVQPFSTVGLYVKRSADI